MSMQKAIFAYRWIRYGAAQALRMEYKDIMTEVETLKNKRIPELERLINVSRKQARQERKEASKTYYECKIMNDRAGMESVLARVENINTHYRAIINEYMREIHDLRTTYIMAVDLYLDHCERIKTLAELHYVAYLYCTHDRNTLPSSVNYGLRLLPLIF